MRKPYVAYDLLYSTLMVYLTTISSRLSYLLLLGEPYLVLGKIPLYYLTTINFKELVMWVIKDLNLNLLRNLTPLLLMRYAGCLVYHPFITLQDTFFFNFVKLEVCRLVRLLYCILTFLLFYCFLFFTV